MADSTYYDDDDDKIARLMSMGFEITASQTALAKSHGDVSRAIDCLLLEDKVAGSSNTESGEKGCEEDRGILETIPDDEAPIPADMMTTSSNRNILQNKGVLSTSSKTMAASSDHDEHSSPRRPMDPPADLVFAPGRNSPTPSSEMYRRKQVLLEKLRSAGVTLPPSTSASLDPTQETRVSENESSVTSRSSVRENILEVSKVQEDPTDRDYSEIQASSSSASPSESSATSPVNRFSPPEFVGLEATRVEPAPVYDAVRIPVQARRTETLSSHENVNSSTHEDGENSSIHPPSTIGSTREEQVGNVQPDAQEQYRQQQQQHQNEDHDGVPWWKKHKIMALVVIIIIPVGAVTVATAATVANKKKPNSSSSNSLKLSANTNSSEMGFNTTQSSTLMGPSFQPVSLENELQFSSPVPDNTNDHTLFPVGVDGPIEEPTESLKDESVEATPIPTSAEDSPAFPIFLGSSQPTAIPNEIPIRLPTDLPTESPTTESPTGQPIELPTEPPTEPPTETPTEIPSQLPTKPPTYPPTAAPSYPLTEPPTESPAENPTYPPTNHPTRLPTDRPTSPPSKYPTRSPSKQPTYPPTKYPTRSPSKHPTHLPTEHPTKSPTEHPTHPPTEHPTKCTPCYWSNEWSRWSECSSVCDGIATRTKECICGPFACPGWCHGAGEEVAPCNESYGRIRFKSQETICSRWGGCWLYASGDEIQANDAYYTYFEQCGDGFLVIEGTNRCLEPSGIFTCNQDRCQEWEINSIGDDFQIRNTCDNCCLGIDRSSKRELAISSEKLIVFCIQCDSSDMSQLWVTWDKPGFCETEDCNPDPLPSTLVPLPSPVTTKNPAESKTKKPDMVATKKPVVPVTKNPVEPVVKDPAPPKISTTRKTNS